MLGIAANSQASHDNEAGWTTTARVPHQDHILDIYDVTPCKRWGSVAELICHLQGSIFYGIKSSHKCYRPSPTKDVT
jgi:hypothetical protein